MPDLAVIMSIYKNDRFEFVKESVRSVLDQTFSDYHFFIVFDGPVYQEIDMFISSLDDDRMKHYRTEHNRGLAEALNYILIRVLKNPEYKYIARMDADDISMPQRFEKQHAFLENNQDVSCCGSWYEEIDEEGKHLSFRKLPVDHENLKKRFYTRTPFAHSSVMYRRTLIEDAGYYPTDTILLEDIVLWSRALKSGSRFANIPEYLLKFRIDNNFLKRRSGIKYGLNFIKNRFRISRSLNFPVQAYIFSLLLGLVKMIPTFILGFIYRIFRKE
jgi:glycosyltransferase involved in cell wall biosynthesis